MTTGPLPYDGPVIDAHHHLWDLSMGRHPWLAEGSGLPQLGDLSFMRHDYGAAEFLADAGDPGVVASVYVEAGWDPARDPAEEVRWLDGLPLPPGIAARCVTAARLEAPDVDGLLAAYASHPRVAGVRQAVRWHDDPALRWADHDLLADPAWRRGAARLAEHGLVLELLMHPHQAVQVAALARDIAGLDIAVNHCGSPLDASDGHRALWRSGLTAMGAEPNIYLKLSNALRYAPSAGEFRDVVGPCLDAFGAARCLWGSNFPVSRRDGSYAGTLRLFRLAIAELAPDEQRAVMHDTAARLYGLPDLGHRRGDAPDSRTATA